MKQSVCSGWRVISSVGSWIKRPLLSSCKAGIFFHFFPSTINEFTNTCPCWIYSVENSAMVIKAVQLMGSCIKTEWGNLAAKVDPHEAKCLFRMEGNFLRRIMD